ncbi:LLM class flavin-dependent oxidoreductase [Bacillus sp. NEB1478]|uniref:LLM class flavin-dependent oxidoreductase n=1 Tax=Bacillus sp. NEB1478 TaxID=3073816 RepID=UPI0028730C29|nr:LLM class flavin-dependent oxidoreductase [Bacillus sp. NEB1478]WNB92849.1 LLM class flavin-dependent oxidoreductase [Bacillus sp. NEB1478]
MRLSILDQSPISKGYTAQQALLASLKLAQAGEQFGYQRYWIAEHHNFHGLTCPAPEVMLSYIGANTSTIRIGAGAVLLPHYKPYRIAETYNLLATLFPDRIDLGIGRAPGGSAEAAMALSDNFLANVQKMPDMITELLHFLHNDHPFEHMFSKISASPIPEKLPVPWILGTSEKSARLAAGNGTSYAFGHFMSDKNGPEIINTYRKQFKPSKKQQKAEVIIAVSVICAETTDKAEELALPVLFWRIQNAKGEGDKGVPTLEETQLYFSKDDRKQILKEAKKKMIIGDPITVKLALKQLQESHGADEVMVVTITHRYEDRIKSYKLLANEMI